MPLVTLTLRKGHPVAERHAILDQVHRALVASGVPEADRFQRVIELDHENFRYDGSYPDLARARGDAFVLIEILWSVGRSVKVKRKVAADIVASLAQTPGLDPEQVMLVFVETQWENWAFGGGRLLHALP
jgi:phenylpyruvate tautomerase PptA (4-oxalocrotonate tautomerase family)